LFLFLTTLLATTHSNTHNWDPRSIYSCDKTLFVGNIQFPQCIKTIPQIALYRGGTKINTENDNANKNIQFTISDDKSCKTLFILITQEVIPHIKNHTVQYLKTSPNQSCKFYQMTIVEYEDRSRHIETDKKRCKWEICETKLSNNEKIPDNTLIIIFNPECVEKIEGGNELELPKIVIKQNILDIVGGSEEKLHDQEVELLMSCLDLNLIHTKSTPKVEQNLQKKLIVAMSNPEG